MPDEEIDYADNPKLGEDFFAEAVRWPGHKRQITLRLDPDVLAFFKAQGKGYQTAINAVLRKYVDAQKQLRSKARSELLGRPGTRSAAQG